MAKIYKEQKTEELRAKYNYNEERNEYMAVIFEEVDEEIYVLNVGCELTLAEILVWIESARINPDAKDMYDRVN